MLSSRLYSDYARIILTKAKRPQQKNKKINKDNSEEVCEENEIFPKRIFKDKKFMHSYLHTLKLCTKLVKQREELEKSPKSNLKYRHKLTGIPNPCIQLNEEARELNNKGSMDELFQTVSLNASHDLMKKFAGKDFDKKSFEFLRALKRNFKEKDDQKSIKSYKSVIKT